MNIKETVDAAYANAKNKGFYDASQQGNVAEKLMLIVSEVSEALEAHRNAKICIGDSVHMINKIEDDNQFPIRFKEVIKDSFEDELADAAIRLFDLAGWQGIDLEAHIKAKMRYNATRERLHGKQY